MSFLFDGPTPLDGASLGTVVHIGAGAGDVLDAYRSMKWQRLILVEGDPDTVVSLQAAVGARSHVEILGQAVAPQAGALTWHRHNLPSLNGPKDNADLISAYPRLRNLGTTTLTAVALDGLLKALVPASGRPHLLVLDVPGQEDELLACVPGEVLRRFSWMVLRSRGPVATAGAAAPGQTLARLSQQGFTAVELEGTPGPLWPLTLLRHDDGAFRLSQLNSEWATARAQVSVLQASLEAKTAEVDKLRAQLAEVQQQHGEQLQDFKELHERDVAALRDQHAQALASAAEQAAAEHAELSTELARLRDELESARAAADQDLKAAQAEHLLQSKQAADAAAALQVELDAERAARAAIMTELQQLLQQSESAAGQAASRESELTASLAGAQQALSDERAAHHQTRSELQQQLSEARAAEDKAKSDSGELSVALSQLQADLAAQQTAHARAMAEQQQKTDAAVQAAQRQQEQLVLQAKERQAVDQRTAERIRKLEDEAHSARQAAALSVKLQTLREADLKDLQSRYQVTLAQQQNQHELLTQLAQRLTVANAYFHELSHAEQSPPAKAPATLADDPSPKKRRARPRSAPAAPPAA